MHVHKVPPSPAVLASLYEAYLREGAPRGLTFEQYLGSIGVSNEAHEHHGQDDGARMVFSADGPLMISTPDHALSGILKVKVLLIDFPDLPGTTPASHYENLLFSKGTHPTGSMRDYFAEVSLGKVDVQGTVDGWIRLPQDYSYYANGQSGTSYAAYPRNARRMAEDAVNTALADGVEFDADLDALNENSVTALFLIHAGVGAEVQRDQAARDNNIWSHKWSMPNPVNVGNGLRAEVYLTVPHDARLGVCAHELGHLAFQWEDFYDANYAEDGKAWDGSGDWDLMAGGSYNGNSHKPAHPVSMHKLQHEWITERPITESTRLTLKPFTATFGEAAVVKSARYTPSQYLLLENRTRFGFDSHLPGEGLLVWRVDEAREQVAPDRPALLLVEADGRRDLQRVRDANAGDSGDPFPGSRNRTELGDAGRVSTSFPQGDRSGIVLENITRDADSGDITVDIVIDGRPVDADEPPPPPPVTLERIEAGSAPDLAIPDSPAPAVADTISVTRTGVLRDLTVGIDIEHTYRSDLRVALVSPQGQVALLHNRTGGSAHDLHQTYRAANVPALNAMLDTAVQGDWTLRVSDHAGQDTGKLHAWALTLDVQVAEQPRHIDEQREPRLQIPDNDATGVSDNIDIGIGGIARSVTVDVDITHSYQGDLRVELVSPNGDTALLHNRTGASMPNVQGTYTTQQAPQLARFVLQPVQGTWTLRVSDHEGQDVGELRSWRLRVELAPALQTVEQSEAPNVAIPDNSGAGIGRAFRFEPAGTVQAIRLEVVIRHSYIGDLEVALVAPSGERAFLHRRGGGRTRDLVLDLDSSTSNALQPLVGQALAGDWILRVADRERIDVGKLESWRLEVDYVG